MDTLAERLRGLIAAFSDPTRGAIVMELEHMGELTPTQLARRLGLTANNVYHHMRVLRELGVVEPPRAVPRETYVEKYYRLTPELLAAIPRDPQWLDRAQAPLTPQDRKALFIGLCLTLAHLLLRAARRYEAMDAEALDRLINEQQFGMLSINTMGRERLTRRLAALRDVQREEAEGQAEEADSEAATNVVLMAALPLLWDEPDAGARDADARKEREP